MSYSHQQFQRELQNRGIDKQTAYMLSLLFEAFQENSRQVEAAMTVLNGLADTVGRVVELHHHTKEGLKELNKLVSGHVDGVSVTTEPGKGN